MADNLLDRLHLRMTEIYGHRWTSAYTRESLETWAKGLAGLSAEQVGVGVSACISGAHAWPPTLPEFRALCLTVPGLPSLEDAWAEALPIARRWKKPHECSHPAIYHALSQVVNYNMVGEEVLQKRFERNYERVCADLANGLELSPVPQPLPAPKPKAEDFTVEECRRKRVEALAALDELIGRRTT